MSAVSWVEETAKMSYYAPQLMSAKSQYIETITKTYMDRAKRNPRYSLAAFARDLGVSKPTLSQLLSRKKGLSLDMARKIAPKLTLNKEDHELFMAQVAAVQHRSQDVRKIAEANLSRLETRLGTKDVTEQLKPVVLKWYHGAMVALIDLVDFSSEPIWLAEALGISQVTARKAWKELVAHEILAFHDGRWQRTGKTMKTHASAKSELMLGLYRDSLKLAEKSVDLPTAQRHHSTLFVSMNESDYQFAVESLHKFCLQLLNEIAARGGSSDRVCNLAIQLFPVTSQRTSKD